jgi:hypothetical protein
MGIKLNYDWICSDIEYEFSMLEDFFEKYHSNLPDMEKRGKDEIDRILSEIEDPEERQSEGSGMYEEHFLKYEDFFPNQMNYLLVIMLYTFLERNLQKVLYDYSVRNNLPFAIEGFEGDLGTKLMRFIMCYKPDSYIPADIQSIKELALIRNNIVHSDGRINKGETKIQRYISDKGKDGRIIHIEYGVLYIKKEYCDEYREKVIQVFRNIFRNFGYRTNYSITVSR